MKNFIENEEIISLPEDTLKIESIYGENNYENEKILKKSRKKADIIENIKIDTIQLAREKEEKEKLKKKKLNEIQNKLEKITKESESNTYVKSKLKVNFNEPEIIKKDVDSGDEERILPDEDKIKIKERMATFKLRLYDKLDLKMVLEYWIEKRAMLKKNKSMKIIPKITTEKVKNSEKEENKINNSTTTNVKYEFKKPNKEILKIIPFCSNIFNIEKKES